MVQETKNKSLNAIVNNVLYYQTKTKFDIITSILAFNYIKEKKKAFSKIAALLKEKGIFILSECCHKKDVIVPIDGTGIYADYYPLSKKEYCKYLKAEGFNIKVIKDLYYKKEYRQTKEDEKSIGFLIKAINSGKRN